MSSTSVTAAPYGHIICLTLLRIQLSRTGTVAWVAADLVVEGARSDRAVELSVRASWVIERQGESWKIMQGHLQVPVSREEIAQAVFGASRE